MSCPPQQFAGLDIPELEQRVLAVGAGEKLGSVGGERGNPAAVLIDDPGSGGILGGYACEAETECPYRKKGSERPRYRVEKP